MQLEYLGEAGKTKDSRRLCLYRCGCGATTTARERYVASGHTRSCGCLLRASKNVKHGMKGTRTYKSWASAKDRTTNPKCSIYYRYGGAGIGLAERWHSFANFFADMGERPEGTSLDRINPNGNYEPGNCRWATARQQAINKNLLTTNVTGIPNVYIKPSGAYLVAIQRGRKMQVYKTMPDFFEACCLRMAFVNQEARNA
jgi:hypothetical protein